MFGTVTLRLPDVLQVSLTSVPQVCSPARADVLLQLEGKDHKLESLCKIEYLRRRAWESAEQYN